MSLGELRLYYVIACVALSLIILSPAIAIVVPFPSDEAFSEILILGPDHIIGNTPQNISAHTVYTIYVDVGNHMGELEYYAVLAKLRFQSEPLPDVVSGQPSSAAPVYEFRMFAENNELSEKRFDFSFDQVSFDQNTFRVQRISINGYTLNLDNVGTWDSERSGFYFQFFFELWLYNRVNNSFEFNSRYVQFWMNMTQG